MADDPLPRRGGGCRHARQLIPDRINFELQGPRATAITDPRHHWHMPGAVMKLVMGVLPIAAIPVVPTTSPRFYPAIE
ncbi:MAG: hypothetical protein QNJ85_14410 [Gammaproteobacteria bacterium]|nr:hypothetical protein [Gammaproteobacteria bacterium]